MKERQLSELKQKIVKAFPNSSISFKYSIDEDTFKPFLYIKLDRTYITRFDLELIQDEIAFHGENHIVQKIIESLKR